MSCSFSFKNNVQKTFWKSKLLPAGSLVGSAPREMLLRSSRASPTGRARERHSKGFSWSRVLKCEKEKKKKTYLKAQYVLAATVAAQTYH